MLYKLHTAKLDLDILNTTHHKPPGLALRQYAVGTSGKAVVLRKQATNHI